MPEEQDPRGFNFQAPADSTAAPSIPPASPGIPPAAAGASPAPAADAPGGEESPLSSPRSPRTDVWQWTQQYAKRPDRPRKDDEETPNPLGLEAEENRDLASMYVSPEKSKKVHDGRITYSLGPETPPFPWKWVLLAFFLLCVAGAAALAIVKIDTGESDANGRAVHRTPLMIIWLKLSGQKQATVDPEIMAYLATKDRIDIVRAAALEYYRQKGAFPGLAAKLVENKNLPEDMAKDGWGRDFVLVPIGQKVISLGSDGKPDTSDDIIMSGEGLNIPSSYQAYEIEKGKI